jgi:hypothetical protein
MQKILGLSLILILAFSSIFFIDSKEVGLSFSTIEKVEAKLCPPGQYPDHGPNGYEKTGVKCLGSETISKGENGTTLSVTMHELVKIYNVVAGVLLALSIISIIIVGYIYISPFGTTKLNGGGGKAINVQDNTNAKMFLLSIALGIVLILSGFTVMRLVTEIVGF